MALTDMEQLAEGELTLYTAEGEVAARLKPQAGLVEMTRRGTPPAGLLWGERFFHLDGGRYVEAYLAPVYGSEISAADAAGGPETSGKA